MYFHGKRRGVSAGRGGPGGAVRWGCAGSEQGTVAPRGGGTNEGLPPPRLSSRGAMGSSSVLPGLPLLWGGWRHPGRGQILVLLLVLVVGSPCPAPEAAVGKGGAGVTFVGADWQFTSHTPPDRLPGVSCSPPAPWGGRLRRRAGGRASPSACVGWVPAAALRAGAGTETCWHLGAAAGDAVGCSLRPQGPSPTSSVPPPTPGCLVCPWVPPSSLAASSEVPRVP